MLFVLFQLGDDRYALDAGRVAAVLPWVRMTRIAHAPAGIAGLFDYHGTPLPALDLSELTLGRPADRRLSTRIVVVHYDDPGSAPRQLGLIAEKATSTIRRDPAEFVASGLAHSGAPYLRRVLADARGLVQWVDIDRLLTASMRDALAFPQHVET